MKHFLSLVISVLIIGCSANDRYDVAHYYSKHEQDSIRASIITYIFIAPPYALMKDRFKPAHRKFYTDSNLLSKFSIDKYFVDKDSTNYFYVLRPAPKLGEKRGVGGYFKMDKNYKLTGFREVFVTPVLSEQEAKAKGSFLFDKMVKGEIDEYLKMKSYVQWPNEASSYDTTLYEWVLNKKALENQNGAK